MKTIIPIIFTIFLSGFVACKKDPVLPTSMRVKVDNDTVFTTTKVISSTVTPGTLYIKGTSEDGTQSVELTLLNYERKPGTFTIDNRGIGTSTGQYLNGSKLTVASGGKIVVTSVTDGVVKGTFNIYYFQTDIMGSFTAPQ